MQVAVKTVHMPANRMRFNNTIRVIFFFVINISLPYLLYAVFK